MKSLRFLAICGVLLCVVLIGAAAVPPAEAANIIDGCIFYNNGTGSTKAGLLNGHEMTDVLWTYYDHNDEVDPLLGDPYNIANPNWVPAVGSPAVCPNDTVAAIVCHADWDFHSDAGVETRDAHLIRVPYRGALPPAAWGEDWTQGWTYYGIDGLDRTDIDTTKTAIEFINEALDTPAELHWTADYQYLLYGRVYVPAGYALEIDPGVLVRGDRATTGYLAVDQGGQIRAIGTADAPIVFTSAMPFGEMSPGDWGGIILHGQARGNCAACSLGVTCESEGDEIQPGVGAAFCGNNDCDDSGTLRYVRIEYAGHEIVEANELNALTMNALGTGTDISFVQAHRGSDDNFEWFGGTNHAHHLVATGGLDDNFDWQAGFRGSLQFGVCHSWPSYATGAADRGIEADNWEHDYAADCKSNPVIANCTFVGPNDVTAANTDGIHLRRGTNFQIYNSISIGWPDYGVQFKDAATFNEGFFPQTGAFCPPAEPVAVEESMREALPVSVSPNPAAARTSFSFTLASAGRATITVFDSNGRCVDTVCDEVLAAGLQSIDWHVPSNVDTGTYFYRVATDRGITTGRIFAIAR